MKLFQMLSVLLFAATGALAESHGPDTGFWSAGVFGAQFDDVCGLGTDLAAGCDAIRDREIIDAAAAPWRAIGRVNFAGTTVRQHCTGTLVAEDIVLTAAHCLYDFSAKTWISAGALTFAAGFQRGEAVAASTVQSYVLNPSEDPSSRDFRSRPEQDWALLTLDMPIGREVGFLGVALAPSDEPPAYVMAGYAGLRSQVLSVAHDCGVPEVARTRALVVRCSTMKGDSGAPLLVDQNGTFAVAGVFSSIVGMDAGFASLVVPVPVFGEGLSALR